MNSNRFLANITAMVVILLTNFSAYASFHTWKVNEIYSNADGSVQFIEMKESSGLNGQNALAGHSITCTGPAGTTTFNFSNISSTATANKFFIIATSNLVSTPGGLTPDFVFTNAGPFLSLNSGSINFSSGFDIITYTNLPTNGSGAMSRSGSVLVATTNNSPVNFNGASNSIVPLRILSNTRSGNNFVVTFATATGTNGTAGPNYALQTTNILGGTNWSTLTNLTGNGSVRTITNSINTSSNKFFRLRVP